MANQNENQEAANQEAAFQMGQTIRHRLFGYRGVIFDVDPEFAATDEWYEQMARSKPPKDRPWYHVLVHDAEHTTYVAEQNLTKDNSGEDVTHPLLTELFDDRDNAEYRPLRQMN